MKTNRYHRVGIAALLASTAAFHTAPAFAEDETTEVFVTRSPLERPADDSLNGVSVLSGDDLQDQLAPTIGETLKNEPGVSSTFFGAGASRPVIRGQDGDRIRVLNNGVGSIDASSSSPDHAVAAEPAQAERIEVVRGASLLRYGSSAAGGVVNVIDGRIPTELPEDEIDGAFRVGGSSVDDGKDLAGSVNVQITPNFVLHVDGTWREADDFDIPGLAESSALRAQEAAEEEEHEDEDEDHEDEHEEEEEVRDTLENSFVETDSFTIGGSFIGNRGHLGVAYHEFNSDYGVPGGHGHGHGHDEEHEEGEEEEEHEEEHEEEEEGDVTIGLEQKRVDINGALELDGFFERLQIFGGYADYEHIEFEGPGVVGTVFTNEGYEMRGEAIQRDRNGWRAAYGVHWRQRDFAAIGEEAFTPPSETQQIGLYTFQEKDFGQAHLEGALRYESSDVENTVSGVNRTFDLISVSAGGDFHLTDLVRIGGTVYRTERSPTSEELFSDGPHLATNQFEVGDADLDKEVATGVEAIVRFEQGGRFLTLNAFYTDYSDFIFARETGDEEDELPVFQFTADDATFTGFELQGGTPIATVGLFDIAADGLVEFVRAETDDDDLPRIPPLSFLAGLEAKSDQFSFRAEVDYAAEQDDVSEFELPTDSYTLTNFYASWTPPVDSADWRLSVALLNAFDEEARQHTSFLKDSVPLPGRNVRVSLRTTF